MPSKLNGLLRKLTWQDFGKPKPGPPPAPGQKATAAFTEAKPSFQGVNFAPLPGTKPPQFQLADNVTVSVDLQPNIFVMEWVFKTQTKQFQNDLLKHEQGHYTVAALLARDFFIDLMQLKLKQYSNLSTAQSDFNQIRKDSIDKQKAIESLYDQETQSGLSPAPQSQWDNFFNTAFTQARSTGGQSPDGTPYKVRLVEVLRGAGKKI